jgi:hypothetical protein
MSKLTYARFQQKGSQRSQQIESMPIASTSMWSGGGREGGREGGRTGYTREASSLFAR